MARPTSRIYTTPRGCSRNSPMLPPPQQPQRLARPRHPPRPPRWVVVDSTPNKPPHTDPAGNAHPKEAAPSGRTPSAATASRPTEARLDFGTDDEDRYGNRRPRLRPELADPLVRDLDPTPQVPRQRGPARWLIGVGTNAKTPRAGPTQRNRVVRMPRVWEKAKHWLTACA